MREPLMGWRGKTLTLLVCGVAGCVKMSYEKPIANFEKSVSDARAVVAAYYTDMNKLERRVYLDDKLTTGKEVFAAEGGKPTPLLGQTFSPAGIQARLDGLTLLGVYVHRLGELAASDAPSRFQTNAKVLGENLGSLSKSFADLARTGDPSAAAYAGPVGTIVGLVGSWYLEAKRDQAVKDAIGRGAAAVNQILDTFERDLSEVVTPLRLTASKQILAERATEYNDLLRSSDYQRMPRLARGHAREEAIQAIEGAAAEYDFASSFRPVEVVTSMREAHDALLKFAQAPKRPDTFTEFVAALEVFDARTSALAAAVQELRLVRHSGAK